MDLQQGESVFQQGQKADAIFQIVTGEVHLIRDNSEGQRILLYRARDNDFFAEASLSATHYHCMAQCVTDCRLKVYPASHILKLLADDAEFALAWINFLSIQLRRQRSMVERLNMKSAADRLRHYLLTEGEPEGELLINGTLTKLAEQLGLSRESLYRTLSRLKQENRIEQKGKRLRLL